MEAVGTGVLAAFTIGQKRATTATSTAATFVDVGQLTGGLGLVAIASKSNTTVPTNQSPVKKTKPNPNPIPKTVGSVTP
jgi:ethanolamine transporter EutH